MKFEQRTLGYIASITSGIVLVSIYFLWPNDKPASSKTVNNASTALGRFSKKLTRQELGANQDS